MSEQTKKKKLLKGLSKEFKKVIWPDKKELTRQTTVVVICTIALGVIIAIVDFVVKSGVNVLINL